MAIYHLSLNEFEEHTHSEKTYTTIISGTAKLFYMGIERILNTGDRIQINANEPHKIVNVGSTELVINCEC